MLYFRTHLDTIRSERSDIVHHKHLDELSFLVWDHTLLYALKIFYRSQFESYVGTDFFEYPDFHPNSAALYSM